MSLLFYYLFILNHFQLAENVPCFIYLLKYFLITNLKNAGDMNILKNYYKIGEYM